MPSESKQYTCELCKKIFTQKNDFMRHKNRKQPCITLTELQQMAQSKEKEKELETDTKSTLIRLFKSMLNILRDNEGLTGEKALRNMSYLIILKLIEPRFGNEIDIDGYNYDLSYIEDHLIEHHKKKLLEIVRFSNLVKELEDNVPTNIKFLWDDILSKHPATCNIFLRDKGFDIQRASTYKKLFDKLKQIPNTDIDVLGNAYEEVIQDIMTGKVLGQFFTQPLIKKMMVKLIDPQIKPDGTIETCGDPAMGTGGFLITYLQYILQQAKVKGIEPNWSFIKTQGLYGKELEPDTYQLAISNMLISSGHMFEEIERGDSIREPITRKFDNILTNPPFGIKGLKYDDIRDSLKAKYIPIKSDNAVSLFIQAIIYMLKINGKCAIVLPDGQDLFSKTNKTLILVREYLMKTCDLKAIYYLPSGIFTYTSIKTCIMYFVKKREGDKVLKTELKISKIQKVTGRNYKFSKTLQTTKVKFYDYNPYEDIKNLLVEVSIEDIANNFYSLNYTEYLQNEHNEEEEEEQRENGIEIKTLEEICDFLPKSKRPASYGEKQGRYPFFKSSPKITSFVDEPDYNQESLIIGDGGEPNINYGVKFSASDHCYIMQNKDNDVNLKYIYYYLLHNLNIMTQLYTGVAIKNISKTNIKNIKIPIPPLEKQRQVVEYLDFIYEKANKTSMEKINELRKLNEYCLNNQKIFGNNVVKTLGEICSIEIGGTPSRSKSEYYVDGNNLWISVRELNGGYIYDTKEKINDLGVQKSNVKLFNIGTILFSFKLSIGKTAIVGKSMYSNEAIAGLVSLDSNILDNKYLYYYLTINDFSKLGAGLLGNGSLNKKSLACLKIPIPPLKKQREIVEYCEHGNKLIEQLESDIKQNKELSQLFMSSVINSRNIEQSDSDLSNIDDTINVQDEILDEEIIIKSPKIKKEKTPVAAAANSDSEEEIVIKKRSPKKVEKTKTPITTDDDSEEEIVIEKPKKTKKPIIKVIDDKPIIKKKPEPKKKEKSKKPVIEENSDSD